jgi:hypothetical protein
MAKIKMTKITDELRNAIIQEKQQNPTVSTYELSKKYGISTTTIIKILRAANINTSKYRLSRERREHYFRLIEEALANGISFYGELTKYLCEKTGLTDVRARQIKKEWLKRDPKRAKELIQLQRQKRREQEEQKLLAEIEAQLQQTTTETTAETTTETTTEATTSTQQTEQQSQPLPSAQQ